VLRQDADAVCSFDESLGSHYSLRLPFASMTSISSPLFPSLASNGATQEAEEGEEGWRSKAKGTIDVRV
jgi:hypothetical protein